MKRNLWVLSFITVLLIVFSACEKSFETEYGQEDLSLKKAKIEVLPEYAMSELQPNIDFCGEADTAKFLAGQNYHAGNVFVNNTKDSLYVTVKMIDPWKITLTHIYVGDFEDIPLNAAGNPKNGHFPYSDSFKKGTDLVTYSFPMVDLSAKFVILVHSDVKSGKQSETAWAFGKDISEATRWGWYIDYELQLCGTLPR